MAQAFNKMSLFKNIKMKGQPDVFLAVALVTIVALFLLPIPTFIIDILICISISASLIVLLLAIYITDSLKLSSFPSILLMATLFRLGLNVATSRLILLNADAGEMILAFGNTAVGGNLVVGIVIFLLLMLINMLVVAKGSERVAEVAARFTLDAMPGKQMSIDADLRAGIINNEQAQKKREQLSSESQLFGAMDGAMKFVKGDVIAGVIIFVINIIAGIIIGTLQHGMSIEEALTTFAILSVGDGLVSIIPGLLMSVCAGLIVTRVDDGSNSLNLSYNLTSQLLSYPKAFFLAAIFIGFIGQLPGLPTIPLTGISIVAILIGLMALRHQKGPSQGTEYADASFEHEKNSQEDYTPIKNQGVLPICIEVSNDLIPYVNDGSNFITELIPLLRESLQAELGVDFPGIRVRGATETQLNNFQYVLLINEIPTASGEADIDKCMVPVMPHDLKTLGINDYTTEKNPITNLSCTLTSINHKEYLESLGYITWDAPSRILLHLSAILRKNASDFITIHETQEMLDRIEGVYPALVKEVVPKAVNLFQLTDILKRLLSEEVSIKDIKTILQALAEHGLKEQNTVILTEHIRTALSRYLCHRFGNNSNTLLVYLLSPEVEEMIRESIEHHESGSYLALDQNISQDILDALRFELNQLPSGAKKPVILCAQDIRRFVRKLIELEFFEVAVLSFHELISDIRVQPIGKISVSQKTNEDESHKIGESVEDPFELAPAMPS